MKAFWLFLALLSGLMLGKDVFAQEVCPTMAFGNYNCVEQQSQVQTFIQITNTKPEKVSSLLMRVPALPNLQIPDLPCQNKEQTVEYCSTQERQKDLKTLEECRKRFGPNSFLMTSKSQVSATRLQVDRQMFLKPLGTNQSQHALDLNVTMERVQSPEMQLDIRVDLKDAQGETQSFHWQCVY